MTKRMLLGIAVFALGSLVPHALSQTPQFGTIEGIVTRLGTTEPIPDVQITVGTGDSPALGARQAQIVLDTVAAGNGYLPDDLVEAAQNTLRGGARGTASTLLKAVSDSAGHFVINNVPTGSTIVRAQLQGFFGAPVNGSYPATASTTVTVVPQQAVQARLALVPGGGFGGRVLDPSGKPVVESVVQALRLVYQNGVATFATVDAKPTDDRGEFRFFRLPPGEYFVAASPSVTAPSISNPSDVPVTTLHPNATDITAATSILLRAGEELSGRNIQIRNVAAAKVSGKLISNLPPMTGQRGRPTLIMLVPRGAVSVPELVGTKSVSPNPTDGTFEFSGVATGAYEVIARAAVPATKGWGAGNAPALAGSPWAFGRTPVEVRGVTVADVPVILHVGEDVRGQLVVDGKPSSANVRIGLMMDDTASRAPDPPTLNTFAQIMGFQPPIGSDGSFTIPLVPEGKYKLIVSVGGVVPPAGAAASAALPASAYVADVRQGSNSVYDNGLNVGREAVNPIQVLVNTNGGSIEGVVTGSDQKPVPSATVVLVPASERRQNPLLYKTSRSDAGGRFVFGSVPPGSYKVFAWEEVPPGAWQNAEFLARYEQRGTSISVSAGSRVTAGVSLIGSQGRN